MSQLSNHMPLRGRQSLAEQRVFFVTTTVRRHYPLFKDEGTCRALKEIIGSFLRKNDVVILGYVIMPTHVHLMIAIRRGGPVLSAFMRDIKRVSAKELAPRQGGIWEKRFDDVAIFSEKQFRTKLNYVHNNPVKAGLVTVAEDYPFSSAAAWISGKPDPLVTTSLDFVWPSREDA